MNYIVHYFVCILSMYHEDQLMMELNWTAAAKKQREEILLKLSNFQEMTWPIKCNYSVDLMFH